MAATAFVAVFVTAPAAMAGGVSPNVCVSPAGWYYDVTSNQGLILDGKGKPTIFHNGTLDKATQSLTQSSQGTVEWAVNGSITATGGYDFGVVKAGVQATVGGSYKQSNTEDQTRTVSITVRPGYYGILQTGVFRRKTTGHYYYDRGNCTTTSNETVTTKLPVLADSFDSTTNTTGIVPWDQQ